ncbi:MAG: purine-nucleoside phosphorylase [Rhodobacteraceae bacterium]|nr:purine-nucleoside phosphorylase [Paracoccaceae bacterium]
MSKSDKVLAQVQARAGHAPVALGLILGSGLGHIADMVEGEAFDYAELEGFPVSAVSGHSAKLVVGQLWGQRVAVFGGRAHYYERGQADAMRVPLELLKALGADRVILTNAAGSFRSDIPPGDLMLISDHINFSGLNPLIGEDTDARFVNMTNAYNAEMRAGLEAAAKAEDIPLKSGTYSWYSGPSFETPAEINALKILGTDAVGMSTVPEVILARFLGLEAAAISVITNMAAGLGTEDISHAHTKNMAPIGAAKLEKILRQFIEA